MAEITNLIERIDERGRFYTFSMSNKPQYVFSCDLEDLKILQDGSTWYVHMETRTKNPKPYIRTTGLEHKHFHRLILTEDKFSKDSVVDHKDRNTLNCRRYNLRVVDLVNNSKNQQQAPAKVSHRGIAITEFERDGLTRFQCYAPKDNHGKRKYIGSAKTVDLLVTKIDKFLGVKQW